MHCTACTRSLGKLSASPPGKARQDLLYKYEVRAQCAGGIMSQQNQIIDRKSAWTYAIFSRINALAVAMQFQELEIVGEELIPQNKPFILVSNHVSRWDGLVVFRLLNRPANV